MINFAATDINQETAERAFHGTSFSPEKRGESVIQEYVGHMTAVVAEFTRYATDENREALTDDLEAYRQGYLSRLNTYLHAHANCVSSFIAGPSKFPVASQSKKSETADRRLTELLEYTQRMLAQLRRQYNPQVRANAPISSDDDNAIVKLQAKIEKAEQEQAAMKAANAVIRKKGLTDDEKVAKLGEMGIHEGIARELLKPDFAGRVGYADYLLTNNNANIRRMKQRITQLERERSRETVERQVEGVTVTENVEENRLQLKFDDKPSADVRRFLKQNGFRWAPSLEVWQRQLNDNARHAAERMLEYLQAG